MPQVVICDSGSEFKGMFERGLEFAGLEFAGVSLAERKGRTTWWVIERSPRLRDPRRKMRLQ